MGFADDAGASRDRKGSQLFKRVGFRAIVSLDADDTGFLNGFNSVMQRCRHGVLGMDGGGVEVRSGILWMEARRSDPIHSVLDTLAVRITRYGEGHSDVTFSGGAVADTGDDEYTGFLKKPFGE